MIITSFSDFYKPLDEYPKHLKGNSLHKWILKNLNGRNRISVWELDCTQRMVRTMFYLDKINKIKLDHNLKYPYVGVEVL
tara:strand:+ start:72783 stop:73022 length:240 start_codon:yes stop_codon:yes gene_type:complete